MGEIQYDPKVLREHAKKLYEMADAAVSRAFIGGAIKWGGSAGVLVYLWFVSERAHGYAGRLAIDGGGLAMAAIGAGGVAGVLSALDAEAVAAQYRLQAQTALCQVQIEANSRSGIAAVQPPPT